jgi:putative phosphoribosyl transferase
MDKKFIDRSDAGKRLAVALSAYQDCTVGIVLALPRGGVPVAFEIATRLHLPLDVWIVRKLGVPNHKELAMGAIASSGERVMNWDVVKWSNISTEMIEQVVREETAELERRDQLYRQGKPWPTLTGKIVILVDDGIATGATMQAAIASIRQQKPKQIIVAVPVAPPSSCAAIQREVDQVVCLLQPESLDAIGLWYENFEQTSDREVRDCLTEAAQQFQAFSSTI